MCRHLVLVAAFLVTARQGDEFHRQAPRFGGGMAVQAGYVSLENSAGWFDGPMLGLGGRLHVYLPGPFRVGGGGASVRLSYGHDGVDDSEVRIGYGGMTAELTHRISTWRFSAGMLAGGGRYRNVHVLSKERGGTANVLLDNRTTFLLAPLVTFEYMVSPAISLMAMADFLWGPDLGERRHLGGPKLHAGILFNR
ncbi:MAG: hypothetical protein GF418_14485 [Chitinivibrionales bacterium]|nr:hypothetical protein [Chitinivibrionales bacterium]